jgi:hypothetical protein
MPEPRSNPLWDTSGVPFIDLGTVVEEDVNPEPILDDPLLDNFFEDDDEGTEEREDPRSAAHLAALREQATWPAAVSIPLSHAVFAHTLGSRDATMRVTRTTDVTMLGTLQPATRVYAADWNAMGVLVRVDAQDSAMWQYLVRPDPGPAREYALVPMRTRDVPVGNIHPTRAVDPDVTMRVTSHRITQAIGRIMPAGVAHASSSSSSGVVIGVRRTTRGDSRRWLAPDPGEASIGGYNIITPPPVPVPRGHVVEVSSTPLEDERFRVVSSVIDDLVGTIGRCRELYDRDYYATGVLLDSNSTYYEAHPDPGPLAEGQSYLLVDPPCVTCNESRDECNCVRCHTCRRRMTRQGAITMNGNWYHDTCGVTCASCGNTRNRASLVQVQNTNRRYCATCVHPCAECNDPAIWLSGSARYCMECLVLVQGGQAGVRGYGHTHATRWLGGPLPKNDRGHQVGFYVGFELEVTSSSGSTHTIKQWAQENLGYRDALDTKSDSSVHGFEIASQPMTPEFFESVDWESLMVVLNADHPPTRDSSESREPVGHGLHVHIGRVAFERDDVATAMFTYLIGQDNGTHLERIGRRPASHWCAKVPKPASAGLVNLYNRGALSGKQVQRLRRNVSISRDAINLGNQDTIEIRAFRSTRDADHLRAAVRTVYLAAQYIAHLRGEKGQFGGGLVSPKSLHWDAFMKWVETVNPDAAAALRV